MENKISDLENYTIKPKNSNEEPVKRCKFYYLQDDYLWKEFDVEGHYDLESAFDLAKNIMSEDVIHMALKEAIKSLDIPSKNFHFIKDGETEDLRDYTFDKDILDNNSEIFNAFKQLLLNNWNDDIVWYYLRADVAKNVNIHDDTDKKRVYDHYFDSLIEFKNRISFLEYYETYSVDWGENSGIRRIHYDLTQYGDFHCIDNSVTREDLKKYLKQNKISVVTDDEFLINTVAWGAFAYYYGMHKGLNDIESKSFANVLSGIFTDLQMDQFTRNPWDTKKHFKEDEIRSTLRKIISRTIEGNITNHAREIFFSLFDIYKNNIRYFEYKSKRLDLRVSQSQYNQFMALPGESKADKLNNLLKYPEEKINYSTLPEIEITSESVEEWSKNKEIISDLNSIAYRDEWFHSFKPDLEYKYGEDYEINLINSERGYMTPGMISFMEDINQEMEYYANMTPEEIQSEMEWLQQMDEYDEMMGEYESMTPEEIKAELEWIEQEENEKMMEEIKEEFENMSPEELQAEFEEIKQEKENKEMLDEIKKELESKDSNNDN